MGQAAFLAGAGILFAIAGAGKLLAPGEALDALAGALSFPWWADRLLVAALGSAELALGLGIVAGGRVCRVSSKSALGLVGVLTAWAFARMAQGHEGACGCGLPGVFNVPLGPGLLLRNLLLALAVFPGVRAPDPGAGRRAAGVRLGMVSGVLLAALLTARFRGEGDGRPSRHVPPLETIAVLPVREEGEALTLADLHPSHVFLFRGGCGVCEHMVPDWNLVAEALPGGPEGAVAVALDGADAARALDARAPFHSRLFAWSDGGDPCFAWGVCSVPEVWVMGADGRIADRWGPALLHARAERDALER